MENLSSEKLINKKEKPELNIQEEKKEDYEEENKKEGMLSTDFEENIELTDEERNLRQNYLKKITKKEALIRSIILAKKQYFGKLYNFIINIIFNVMSMKETRYRAQAINAITAKDLNQFMISVKKLFITSLLFKFITFIDNNICKHFIKGLYRGNILLENFLLKKDIEFFDLYKTGELIDKISVFPSFPTFSIIDELCRLIEHIFRLFYFGYYLYKDYLEMSIAYVIIMIAQTILKPFFFHVVFDKKMMEKAELRQNYINDIIANIRLIKSFGTEKKELNRVNNINTEMKKQSLFKQFLEELYNHLTNANEVLIFYICGKKTISGEMNYGELLIFQEYSGGINGSLSNIRAIISSIKEGIETWKKFLEIYDIDQKIISKKNIIPKYEENTENNKNKKKGFSIIFKNITFSYPTKKNTIIINNLNLNIEPGKAIAIVGSSGSGKTTLTNLLLRFYDVDEGQILINGIDIKDINISWLRKNIGIVSQEPILTSGTIKENILYGIDNYTEKKFIETCKLANVYSFATDKKLFPKGFDTIVGQRGIKVSGGQKQRIAIARSLMKDAKILIFDEATSALDSENEALVQEAINNIINQKKITSIIIAHRLSTVKNANVIYVMNHGKIVEYGTHNELILKNGEYKKLIQRQLVL